MEKIVELPLIKPLLALLKSRKFLIAVVTLIVDMLVAQAPELEPVQSELLTIFTLVGTVLVASIAYEDVGRAKSETPLLG